MTKESKKAKAMKIMKELNIFKDYIDEFESSDKVCFFERFGGFYVEEYSDLAAKISTLENKHKCVVYAITHDYTQFGELYSFLIVTDYKNEWKTLVETCGNRHRVFAYVWNKDDNLCSEFGDIMVQSFGGGIRRIA
jgi:hypothetical protein